MSNPLPEIKVDPDDDFTEFEWQGQKWRAPTVQLIGWSSHVQQVMRNARDYAELVEQVYTGFNKRRYLHDVREDLAEEFKEIAIPVDEDEDDG